MKDDVLRHAALMEQLRASAPGESAIATALLARLLSDAQWLAVLRSGQKATLYLPYFGAADLAMADAARRATDGSSLSGFFGSGEVPLPAGSSLKREDTYGALTVRWIEGALPWAVAEAKPVRAPPVKPPPIDVDPLLTKNLAHVSSKAAVRVSLKPALRAYARQLAQQRDPSTLSFDVAVSTDIVACERAFLEGVAKDLKDGTMKVVTRYRRHGFTELFTNFPKYEAQVTSWRVEGAHTLFFKYRLPTSHLPPLDVEYHVNDGGAAYFEYQCQLPQRSLVDVYVHGEA